MRSLRSVLCIAALAAGVSACSLALDFGPEGQPCDTRNQCLAGYACQAGYCVESGSATDAGLTPTDGGVRPDGGTDGGVRSDGGTTGNALCTDTEPCPEAD
jgi:hypothetical protein